MIPFTRWRQSSERRSMRAYLLGTLDEARKTALEERMFEDEDFHARLREAQHDLFDDYARRVLDPHDRRRFEERLLGPRRQTVRLELAVALAARQDSRTPDQRLVLPAPRLTAVLAGVAVLACGLAGWMARENAKLKADIAAQRLLPAPPGHAPSPAVMRLTLSPRLTRAAESVQALPAPVPATLVRLELVIDDSRPSYSVTIEAAGRGRVWSQTALTRTAEGTVVLWLPAEMLRPGNYEALLHSELPRRELLGSYIFRLK
ncbi:MAG: hypothetical protein HY820_22045 [Acidobacteria bacterium]|nr:hypothetical protein [Acidobacteriota bacterium]